MRLSKKVIALAITIVMLSFGSVYAIEPIPEESGFSGFLSLGAAYSSVKSNMIAGNSFGSVGNRTVDSLTDDPESSSSGSVQFNFDLRYTFASTRTQLGVIMTGSRSVRERIISKERLPEPSTMEARNSMVGTGDSRRMRPTSLRLRR